LTRADNADFLNFRHTTSPALDTLEAPGNTAPKDRNRLNGFHSSDGFIRDEAKMSSTAILSRNAKFRK